MTATMSEQLYAAILEDIIAAETAWAETFAALAAQLPVGCEQRQWHEQRAAEWDRRARDRGEDRRGASVGSP